MCMDVCAIVCRPSHVVIIILTCISKGLVIVVSERMKAQYTMQLNIASASRSVYIHIYTVVVLGIESNSKRKQTVYLTVVTTNYFNYDF